MIDSYEGKCIAEQYIHVNGIILRGVGDTREEARLALKQEKKKYQVAMMRGLSHIYLKPKVDKEGNEITIRSPAMVPYKKASGLIDLKMDFNRRIPVMTRRQDIFVNVYQKEKENGQPDKKDS